MSGRVVRRWIAVAMPAVIAAIVALATPAGSLGDRVLVRVSALPRDWIMALGVTLSVLLGMVTAVWQWRDRQAARALGVHRVEAATDRRRLLQRLDTS
jgi:fumarate reductase subunit D